MTVQELIEKLQVLPPDTTVYIDWHEGCSMAHVSEVIYCDPGLSLFGRTNRDGDPFVGPFVLLDTDGTM